MKDKNLLSGKDNKTVSNSFHLQLYSLTKSEGGHIVLGLDPISIILGEDMTFAQFLLEWLMDFHQYS